jgi:hypothetical protein
LALPLSDSLCTLDLSFSGAADAIVVDVCVCVSIWCRLGFAPGRVVLFKARDWGAPHFVYFCGR